MQGPTTANRPARITQHKTNDQDPEAAQLSIPDGTPDALFARAATVRRLPFTESTPESHIAASMLLVILPAVWLAIPQVCGVLQ